VIEVQLAYFFLELARQSGAGTYRSHVVYMIFKQNNTNSTWIIREHVGDLSRLDVVRLPP